MKWLHDLLTDREGAFDTGRVLVPAAVLTMCYKAIVSTNYDPQTFGVGIGAVLSGFALYLYGDTRRPPS